MEKIIELKKPVSKGISFVGLSLLGCSLISLCSLIKIPFYPVPFTMQTFAIFFLALTQSPKHALGSSLAYLLLGTLKAPVFAGHANSLWILGTCGGYLVSFPIAAYLTSKIKEKTSPMLALLAGQAAVYLLGYAWLVTFFGANVAFTKGILFFIPSDLLKCLMALLMATFFHKGRNK